MSETPHLREEQEEALEAIRRIDNQNKSLIMPTGSGKTRVALKYGQELIEDGNSVAYVTATNAHSEQVLRETDEVNVPVAQIKGVRVHEESNSSGASRDRLIEDYDLGFHIGVFSYSGYFLGGGVRTADTLIIDDAHGIIGQEISYASVKIDRHEWGQQFEDLLEIIKENVVG